MIGALFYFAAGIVLLALGGDSVVKAASGLARRAGLSPFVTGLVLVAFATSVPELAVNLRAMWIGDHALALGNVVGSNIANFGLTLGAAALCAPLLIRWKALPSLLVCLVVATLATILLGQDGRLTRLEGLLLLAAFAGWVVKRGLHRVLRCSGCARPCRTRWRATGRGSWVEAGNAAQKKAGRRDRRAQAAGAVTPARSVPGRRRRAGCGGCRRRRRPCVPADRAVRAYRAATTTRSPGCRRCRSPG